jgi:hypothetical protein
MKSLSCFKKDNSLYEEIGIFPIVGSDGILISDSIKSRWYFEIINVS